MKTDCESTALFGVLLLCSSGFGQTTELVSVDSSGNQGSDDSDYPSISGDGRYVAFESYASDLVSGDTNDVRDVFVHDRQTGTTERVSVDSSGNQGDGGSRFAAISGDGRYVAFRSYASNLVIGDKNGMPDVFVHDRQMGATELVSADASGNPGNGDSHDPAISGNGRYVAFRSFASNLVPGDTNGYSDVFVRDRQTGATELASADSSGNQGNNDTWDSAISGDGRYVAFTSFASNLVLLDTNGTWDVFVHDRQTGFTELASVGSAGNQGNYHSEHPSLSADGGQVAFDSSATNLVQGVSWNGYHKDVFVHDRQAGATELVSVDSSGNQGNNWSEAPSISADGGQVAFHSNASNLVQGDTNGIWDVFVHDRQTGATECVSVDSSGSPGNHGSQEPSISVDGRYVAFDSNASNLVPLDTNNDSDIFVRDRGTNSVVPYCTAGTSASGCQATLSAAGTASASAPSGFSLHAGSVEGSKDGIFFYGSNGRQANPWGNGTSYQCVVPPVKRVSTLAETGTNGQCDGTFTEDLNAFWCPTCPKPHKNPGAGATVQAQLWYRDPASTSNQTTSLSDAVEFGVGP